MKWNALVKLMKFWSSFSKIWEYDLLNYLGQYKKKYNKNTVCVQNVHKQWPLAYWCEKNLTLLKCQRSTDQSIDIFHFIFNLLQQRHMITKNSVAEIKNLVVNHESTNLFHYLLNNSHSN